MYAVTMAAIRGSLAAVTFIDFSRYFRRKFKRISRGVLWCVRLMRVLVMPDVSDRSSCFMLAVRKDCSPRRLQRKPQREEEHENTHGSESIKQES